jgi:hypothetical protein
VQPAAWARRPDSAARSRRRHSGRALLSTRSSRCCRARRRVATSSRSHVHCLNSRACKEAEHLLNHREGPGWAGSVNLIITLSEVISEARALSLRSVLSPWAVALETKYISWGPGWGENTALGAEGREFMVKRNSGNQQKMPQPIQMKSQSYGSNGFKSVVKFKGTSSSS